MDVVLRLFVDRVVGKVHEQVVQVPVGWLLVFFCCKSSKAIVVDINTERVYTIHEDVDS